MWGRRDNAPNHTIGHLLLLRNALGVGVGGGQQPPFGLRRLRGTADADEAAALQGHPWPGRGGTPAESPAAPPPNAPQPQKPQKHEKGQKKRKSLSRKLLPEAWDLLEDIFD